jgi:hypothetical protein
MDTTITKNDNSNVFPHFSNGHVSFLSECCLLRSIKGECLVNDLPQVEQRYGTECFLDLCSRYYGFNFRFQYSRKMSLQQNVVEPLDDSFTELT